jgi:hypothetical protein
MVRDDAFSALFHKTKCRILIKACVHLWDTEICTGFFWPAHEIFFHTEA